MQKKTGDGKANTNREIINIKKRKVNIIKTKIIISWAIKIIGKK